MNTKQIQAFLSIVSEGSFLHAAKQLHTTQSTISSRIRKLEHEFNATLFIHNRAGAKLTPAGYRFIPHARRWASVVEKAHRDIETGE
ncbi:MAG: LysR family transcriptional regulator [Thiothrix sp.]